MSTRAVIAKPAGDGWQGRYHHWDGYPICLGQTLFNAKDRYFDGSVEAMVKRLIDDEPVGWSTINGLNLSLPSGWTEQPSPPLETSQEDYNRIMAEYRETTGPQSFSARGETPRSDDPTGDWITHDSDDWGTEWCYVLTNQGIAVLERRFGTPDNDQGHGVGMFGFGASDTASGGYWQQIGFVEWADPDPDWEHVECGADLERCIHVESYHTQKGA